MVIESLTNPREGTVPPSLPMFTLVVLGSGSIAEHSRTRSVSGRFCGDCTRHGGLSLS